MPKKVIAWDFDGPINYQGNYKDNRTKIIYSNSRPEDFSGDFPYDVILTNTDYLKITLKVLGDNSIESVIASQRLQMIDDPSFSSKAKDMFKALDKVFGAGREFLKKKEALILAAQIKEKRESHLAIAAKANADGETLNNIQEKIKVCEEQCRLQKRIIEEAQPHALGAELEKQANWLVEKNRLEVLQKVLREECDTNKSKNLYLKTMQEFYEVEAQDILLIDDHAEGQNGEAGYKLFAESEGFQFIHAPRDKNAVGKFDGAKDSEYLFEVLIRTIPLSQIHKSLSKMERTPELMAFQICLLDYQLRNLLKISTFQEILYREKQIYYPANVEGSLKSQVSKTILFALERIILETSWENSFLGGVNVIDSLLKETVIIPKRLKRVLDKITEAQKSKTDNEWKNALVELEIMAGLQASKEKQFTTQKQYFFHSFFKRLEGGKDYSRELEEITKQSEQYKFMEESASP